MSDEKRVRRIPFYQELARRIDAHNRCEAKGNDEWANNHYDVIEDMIESLPHGSGIDGKTELDRTASSGKKIVIDSEYHAMDEGGYYDGWIDFKITITPSLMFGADIKITGRFGKYGHVKDYLHDVFYDALFEETEIPY